MGLERHIFLTPSEGKTAILEAIKFRLTGRVGCVVNNECRLTGGVTVLVKAVHGICSLAGRKTKNAPVQVRMDSEPVTCIKSQGLDDLNHVIDAGQANKDNLRANVPTGNTVFYEGNVITVLNNEENVRVPQSRRCVEIIGCIPFDVTRGLAVPTKDF